MSKLSIKSTSRIFIIAASFTFAGNSMAQEGKHLKNHLSTNGAKPVLIVSGDKCPSGFKIWKEAKGRFLLGAGTDISDGFGDEANAPLGETLGEAEHRLSREEMPSHAHKTNIGQHIPSEQDYEKLATLPKGALADLTSYKRANTRFSGGNNGPDDPLGKVYSTLPPYIAVNFCELKE